MKSSCISLVSALSFVLFSGVHGVCGPSSMASYRVTFEALWSEKDFPKQYPQFRPPAQWSKMIGRIHNEGYAMWSNGALASYAFKKFTEESNSDLLDGEMQGFNGIWDSFYAPPILEGTGVSEVDFLASGNFSKVSLAIRIIPSPDWFVGVNAFDLCPPGDAWVIDKTLDLHPMDAGTDRGLTFTSPNWASLPQQKIFQMTSLFPAHRASSFYYPELQKLPPIGKIRFQLMDIYEHKKAVRQLPHTKEQREFKDGLAEEIAREKLETAQILAGEPLSPRKDHLRDAPKAPTGTPRVPTRPIGAKKKKHVPPKVEAKKDCIVAVWSSWSACSKTCGFGIQNRVRKVIQKPVNGKSCPALSGEKWCGSMRNCETKYFQWLKTEDKKKIS